MSLGDRNWTTLFRGTKRFAHDLWKPLVSLAVVEAVVIASVAFLGATPVRAGDTYPQGGNGDCWRAGTPEMCRNTWAGANTYLYMRIIDQLGGSTSHHNAATTACGNWNNALGPQFCSWTAHSNDTWTYLKIDSSLGAPNGYTWNCVSGACPTSDNAGNIVWSEIYLPSGNNYGTNPCNGVTQDWDPYVIAHELGHAYGLAHHGAACSNITLMSPGSASWTGPTAREIGPLPPCSTGAGNGGVRCIYDSTSV
jgi:Metallo-peptidase family M12B Reprolysin-like